MSCSSSGDGKSGRVFSHKKGNLEFVSLQLESEEGSSIIDIALFGAHLTRWEDEGNVPYIFLSEKAVMDGTKPIRGGISFTTVQFRFVCLFVCLTFSSHFDVESPCRRCTHRFPTV